jgi:stearoyl-CoA desaturase (delta-9 desaturase)
MMFSGLWDAPKSRFAGPKATGNLDTLHAVIANRYDVLSRYGKSQKRTYAEEVERLKHWSPRDAEVLRSLKPALLRGEMLAGAERVKPAEALGNCRALGIAIAMRDELTALWERSNASKQQLLRHLQDWRIRPRAAASPRSLIFRSACALTTDPGHGAGLRRDGACESPRRSGAYLASLGAR